MVRRCPGDPPCATSMPKLLSLPRKAVSPEMVRALATTMLSPVSDLDAAKVICIADGGGSSPVLPLGRRGRAAAAVRTSRDGEQHDREDGNPSQGVVHAVLLQMLGGARARCPRKVGRIISGAPHRVQGLCAGVTCSPVRSGWFIPDRSGEVACRRSAARPARARPAGVVDCLSGTSAAIALRFAPERPPWSFTSAAPASPMSTPPCAS